MNVFDNDLPVTVRSPVTAGAVLALSGVAPTIYKRRDGVTYEFPKSVEPALLRFLAAKRRIDQLAEEAGK